MKAYFIYFSRVSLSEELFHLKCFWFVAQVDTNTKKPAESRSAAHDREEEGFNNMMLYNIQ